MEEEEPKFKVGQKVKVIDAGDSHCGKIGSIERIDEDNTPWIYHVRFEDSDWSYEGKKDLELVEDDKLEGQHLDYEVYDEAGDLPSKLHPLQQRMIDMEWMRVKKLYPWINKPNKSIKEKAMSVIKDAFKSKKTKAFEYFGFLDECGNLTSKWRDEWTAFTYESDEVALEEMREAFDEKIIKAYEKEKDK